jgi:hypothetical protein
MRVRFLAPPVFGKILEGTTLFQINVCRWKNNIKMDFKDVVSGCGRK